ncbi:MAG: tRNA (guanosine(37)-N1)-methyltransferase TrmD [Clostridia bacterium]|nr:tRNA (guanosine(37)-N1)-methyltransferase TrmD [Clostridia bacterium]
MRFDVLTLFPEMFSAIKESIIGRAEQAELIEIHPVNIRDFANNKHNRVDDYPYGGGAGMVMQAQPIYDAYKSLAGENKTIPVIYMSPQGRKLTQSMASDIAKHDHVILLCGHYEGVDERIIEEIVTEEISIGDYVLTGGELPAMVLIDVVSRLIPGVLADDSTKEESFSNGLLEYPQYTRPEEFMGRKVPEVLLSGHHENIRKWREEQSLLRTKQKRPELLDKEVK